MTAAMTIETYHVDIDTTGPALERFARALLSCGATIGKRRLVMGPLGRGTTACVTVTLPEDQTDRFRHVCRPIEMRKPPVVAP